MGSGQSGISSVTQLYPGAMGMGLGLGLDLDLGCSLVVLTSQASLVSRIVRFDL